MSLKPILNFFISDGNIKPVNEFIISENEGGIYEVIRIVEGVPLFFEEHTGRFFGSAKLASKNVRFSKQEIKNMLQKLIQKNECAFGNVLISCKTKLKMFFIPHNYPEADLYLKGVKTGILKAERTNPNAKVFQTNVRKKANELILKKDFFEVLLEDHSGRITEGSRSNVFFVKNNKIYTPNSSSVLQGITREKTILLMNNLDIPYFECDVSSEQLSDYEAAFITGTSPKIIPVKSIETYFFDPGNNLVQKLIEKYNLLIRDYVESEAD